MRTFILFFAMLAVLGCKSRKKDLRGEDPVDIGDFIGFFQDAPLPYAIADTQINRKLPDSLLISNKIFTQFVPDSVYTKDYGKNASPKLYAVGKIEGPGKEIYLLVKAATPEKQVGYIVCFDKEETFKTAMPLVRNNPDKSKSLTGSIDKRFTITTSETRKAADGQRYYKLNAYVYNNAGVFTLIKIESNEPVIPKEVYNPIDTFPRKHKLAGDYVKDKKNFVAVRDGKDEKHVLFFVHFDGGKEECSGELKGEAKLVKPNLAYYRQVGDACVLELNFSNNKVALREEQGCGNYRGIKCTFSGTYARKKKAK
ncbi:MAG: hypothetical protein KF746_00875 [Chitinophagaceae bacterium]|nr:hypothetical protein [Chitinophagaceae bacterium]